MHNRFWQDVNDIFLRFRQVPNDTFAYAVENKLANMVASSLQEF